MDHFSITIVGEFWITIYKGNARPDKQNHENSRCHCLYPKTWHNFLDSFVHIINVLNWLFNKKANVCHSPGDAGDMWLFSKKRFKNISKKKQKESYNIFWSKYNKNFSTIYIVSIKKTCLILGILFGLCSFSHLSCAGGTWLMNK